MLAKSLYGNQQVVNLAWDETRSRKNGSPATIEHEVLIMTVGVAISDEVTFPREMP
jgi:hypothetical protein